MISSTRVEGYYGEEAKTSLELEKGLSSLIYYEPILGCATFSLKSISYNFDVWSQVARTSTSPIWIRWGIDTSNGKLFSGWKNVYCLAGKIVFRREFVEVDIEGIDAGASLKEVFPETVYKKKRISEIMQAIASRNGIQIDVEPTQGLYTLYQGLESDLQFIKTVLLPRAVSTTGRADYFFRVKDGQTLIFKTPNITPTRTIYFTSNDPDKIEGDAGELEVAFRRAYLPEENSLSTKFIGFNSISKTAHSAIVGPEQRPELNLAANGLAVSATEPSSIVPLNEDKGGNDFPKKFGLRSQAIWTQHARDRFIATIVTTPLVDINPGEVITLQMTDNGITNSFSAGNYLVAGVKHRVMKSGYNTVLQLHRRGSM